MSLAEYPGLEELARSYPKFKSLIKKHRQLDDLVERLNQRVFLTAREEELLKDLKRKKLKIKEEIDRMYSYLKSSFDFECRQELFAGIK
ncbi:MAG: DUF465 domain-containing protein [Deltaproteobacteria bacterium]|nr:DUF465 domain-containing protein [Deltaproteobacteria bacterium]MCX7953088.1 DUF465 domain-containing protein [Deltaproteobacteria bacterium]